MDLLPTQEQEEIINSVTAVLSDKQTLGEPLSDELWNSAAEQGWFGLGISEGNGGVGYGLVEEVLLFQALGNACAPGPFLATVLAAHTAVDAGDTDLVSKLVSGECKVALAEPHSHGKAHVFDLSTADFVLYADASGFAISDASDTSVIEELDAFDTLIPTSIIATPDRSAAIATTNSEQTSLRANLLVSAYLSGIATATTAQSVSYGIDREQFGQQIGGFQAVKHRCADMATRADVCSSEVLYASIALSDGLADAAFHVHASRVVSVSGAITNARINVQNHGGIGFTWEHTAHRYVTRADVFSNVLGGRVADLEALLEQPAAS